MHANLRNIACTASLLLLVACSDAAAPVAQTPTTQPTQAPADAPAGNLLRMRIDGVEWIADHDIFGAVHPMGYDRAVLVAGSHGPKNADEQAFNIILNAADGPGTYRATTGDSRRHVVQMGNLSPERYLAGGLMLEHDMTIEILRMQASPVLLEARFHGTLNANDGTVMRIEDGKFRYRE